MLKVWPQKQRLIFFGVLFFFWISGVRFSHSLGTQTSFHTDGFTESMSIFAAKHYLDEGLTKNYLLPTYPGFGHGPDGKRRTEPFVYNHYLAGPDLVLASIMKIFGRDAVWVGRLVPHTLTVLAVGWLVLEFALYSGSSVLGLLLLGLLMIPKSLTAWSICLYGHSYVMAFLIAMFAGLFRFARLWPMASVARRKILENKGFIFLFAIGILQMFFAVDWVPLTFVAACSFFFLGENFSRKTAAKFLLGMIAGGTVALLYQLVISTLAFGSWSWVIDNIVQWIRFRNGTDYIPEMTVGDMRLHKVLHEYNRLAYGATSFTALNLLALSAVFITLGFLARIYALKIALRRLAAAVLALVAAGIWAVIMRQHAVAHTHFIPRHYFVVFLIMSLIALPIARQLVMRSRVGRVAGERS